jgi:hypothetical protein
VATGRRTQQVVEEVDPQDQPQIIPEDLDPTKSQVTRPSDLGFGKAREIEVQSLQELPPQVTEDGMMEIRMAETIEEFTFGNPHIMVKLEEGKRYRVPVHVAQYLIGIGKVYLRG